MVFTKNDTGGTDDNIRNQGVIQSSRVHCSGIMKVASRPPSRGADVLDMESQVHCLEREAYIGVLRAFNAQSCVLSWCKEGLLTELRKELRVSDGEHRDMLGKVSSDESIKSLRALGMHSSSRIRESDSGFDPNSMTMRKKLKPGHMPALSSPKYLPGAQPTPMASPFLPADARDDQRGGSSFTCQMNVGLAVAPIHQHREAAYGVKSGALLALQASKKALVLPPATENLQDTITIRSTDKLISEVEKYFSGKNPDSARVEYAKIILRDHERALMEALDKLADVSDGDDSPDQRGFRHAGVQLQRNGRGCRDAVY